MQGCVESLAVFYETFFEGVMFCENSYHSSFIEEGYYSNCDLDKRILYIFNVRSLSQYWICLSVKIKFHFFNQTRYLSQRTFIELVFTIVRRKQWLLHAWWVILRYCALFLYCLEICAFDSWFLWNSMNIRF